MPSQVSTWSADWGPNLAPPRQALHVEQVIDPLSNKKVVGMVRHAGHAYLGLVNTDQGVEVQAQAIAHQYLLAVQALLDAQKLTLLEDDVLAALAPGASSESHGFGWLTVGWRGAQHGLTVDPGVSPRGSFYVQRQADGDLQLDQQLVLLAGRRTKKGHSMGADIGLRVVMTYKDKQLHIYGATLSSVGEEHALSPLLDRARSNPNGLLSDIKAAVSAHFQLPDENSVWIDNLSNSSGDFLRVTGHVYRTLDGVGKSRGRVFNFDVTVDNTQTVVITHNDRLASSHMAAEVSLYESDAASQGPAASLAQRRTTRAASRLEDFRRTLDLNLRADGSLALDVRGGPLIQVLGVTRVGVVSTVPTSNSGIVAMPSLPQPGVGAPGGPAAASLVPTVSDQDASVQAYLRACELFVRMMAFGFDPFDYFRFARLPLALRARPAFSGAPEGDSPNAEIRPFYGQDFQRRGRSLARLRMQLLIKFGSADPMVRQRVPLPAEPGRTRAQYLGVATDPRWAWHEFGHALAFASTGELEFAFAHSAGDALAAITGDPLSELAADPLAGELRFETFPWINVPGRRHGRKTMEGYCWCGQRNRLRLDFSPQRQRHRHGYFQEQLLSSSLFRLYQCLGGDTRSGASKTSKTSKTSKLQDQLMRLEASDYTVYLIMRAISLLGPDTVATARTADQFVSALIEADLGTGPWSVQAQWPFSVYAKKPRAINRTGGRVHKVIRWAFEQQGLFATDDPTATADHTGLPPPVDVFVADQRLSDSAQPDGGYHPVALSATGKAEPWHAHPRWLRVANGEAHVSVGNRGTAQAVQATVQVWFRSDAAGAAWSPLGPMAAIATLNPGQTSTTSFAAPKKMTAVGTQSRRGKSGDALWLLANVHAPADPSNLPLAVPPPLDAADLMELVANDNNLALTRWVL